MADDRIRVGLVGCGGISSLYTSIYAGLVDIAQVVAVADLVDELAEHRRQVLADAYGCGSAHRPRCSRRVPRCRDARGTTAAGQRRPRLPPRRRSGSTTSHEELLQDEAVQAMVLLTATVGARRADDSGGRGRAAHLHPGADGP